MAGKNKKDTSITVALIGAGATILVAFIGATTGWFQNKSREVIPTRIPTEESKEVFYDFFNQNVNKGWDADLGKYDYSNYSVSNEIKDEELQRFMSTPADSIGAYGTMSIPHILQRNLCLMFDTRVSNYSNVNSAVVVILRAANYDDSVKQSYYRINFQLNGDGVIIVDKPGDNNLRQDSIFATGIKWDDNNFHTIKISFQNDELEIYNGADNSVITKTTFIGDDLLLDQGEIRVGTALVGSSQQIFAEFDNFHVYTSCP